MSLDMTSFDSLLKELYPNNKVLNLTYKDHPFYALLKKEKGAGGKYVVIPAIYANPQGASATFTDAQAGGIATSTESVAFHLTMKRMYSIAYVDNLTIESSKNDKAAFMKALQTEIDGALETLARQLSIACFGNGSGSIGQVSSPGASTTLTLVDPEDIVNYEVGQYLQFAEFETTGSLRDSGAALQVLAINRSAGTMTMSANVNSISGIANGDYIYLKGNRNAVLTGIGGWCPETAPVASENFFGVDRSVDTDRLAGLRVSKVGVPLPEALVQAAALVARNGQKLTHFFMNHDNYALLENQLGAKVVYGQEVIKGKGVEIAFSSIVLSTTRGPVKVMADMDCPSDKVYGVNMQWLELWSVGEPIRIFDTDGLKVLRQSTADGVEIRSYSYSNLGCRNPAANIVVTI